MKQKSLRIYLRARRLEWGLSQGELSHLTGIYRNGISDCEREVLSVSARMLIAAELIFGAPGSELFPALYREIEDEVCRAALALHERLEGKIDPRSVRKRKLLAAIPSRIKPIEV